jgi:hypothetical protein
MPREAADAALATFARIVAERHPAQVSQHVALLLHTDKGAPRSVFADAPNGLQAALIEDRGSLPLAPKGDAANAASAPPTTAAMSPRTE